MQEDFEAQMSQILQESTVSQKADKHVKQLESRLKDLNDVIKAKNLEIKNSVSMADGIDVMYKKAKSENDKLKKERDVKVYM